MSHNVKEQFADCGVCPRTGCPIRICYNVFGAEVPAKGGDASIPTILLIMGLASAGPLWDDKFCHAMAAKGVCRVIRFDNRDIGLSTHLDREYRASAAAASAAGGQKPPQRAAGAANGHSDEVSAAGVIKLVYAALQPGRRILREVYALREMALDALRLLAALGIQTNVHLVGMSLGGLIAQEMALQQPRLISSLTLISTRSANPQKSQWPSVKDVVRFFGLLPKGSVSARYAPRIAAAATQAEKSRLQRECEEERAAVFGKAFAKFLGKLAGDTNKFPFDEKRCEYQMKRVFRRSSYIGGCQRQFLVLLNAENRDDVIQRTITCAPERGAGSGRTYIPTLIIHGSRDILCPVDNGRYLHRLYASSVYHEVDGMGHTLPPSMRNRFVSWIWANVACGAASLKSRPPAGSAATPPPQTVPSKL